jgi:hypothetical protein
MLARVVAVSLAGVKLDLGLPSRAIDSLPALELGERCCRGPDVFVLALPEWHLLTTNRSWDRA